MTQSCSKSPKLAFITNKKWASSIIRGQQIAAQLGVPCDPPSFDYGGTLIMIKLFPTNPECLGKFSKVYVDLLDGDSVLEEVSRYPHVGLIAIGPLAKQYLECRVENKVTIIPEHHCNFERVFRDPSRPVRTVGYVGSQFNLDVDVVLLSRALREIDLELKCLFCDGLTLTREDIVKFYLSIDIQLCFRKPRMLPGMPPEMKNPLKLYNAGSFKIPTVSYPELNYVYECDGSFLAVRTLEEIVVACEKLKKDKQLYEDISMKSLGTASSYHIEKIARLYEVLANV